MITNSLKTICGAFLHISIVGVCVSVFGRALDLFYLVEWQFEALIYIMVAAAYLAIGPTLADGGHIRADLLLARLKGKRRLSVELFIDTLGLAVATIASQTSAIFLGRGAGLLLPPEKGLHVRLIAERDRRIAAYAARQQVDARKAAAELDRIDRERGQFLAAHFGPVSEEAERYDMILNMAYFSAVQAADLIEVALRQRTPTTS